MRGETAHEWGTQDGFVGGPTAARLSVSGKLAGMATPSLIPLKQWYCDSCGELIEKPEHAYLEWRDDRPKSHKKYGFRIVHHALHSPGRKLGRDCYYQAAERGGDLDLVTFLGANGLAHLTAWLDYGREYEEQYSGCRVESLREWVELVRRLSYPLLRRSATVLRAGLQGVRGFGSRILLYA